MIDLLPNQTFFVQAGLFLLTYAVLNFLVFKPVLRIIERRKQLTLGAEQESAELNGRAETLIQEYTQGLQEARSQGIALKEKFQKEGQEESQALLTRAREEMEVQMEKARQEISKETKEAQLGLRKYTRELSRELAQKLLGRKVSV